MRMPAVWTIDKAMLRWWGKEHGWTTNEQIAIGLGVAPSTLSRVTNGKTTPGHELLAQIRRVFGAKGFDDIAKVVEVRTDEAS